MKVWVLEDFSHGETEVYAEDTDVLKIPFVSAELSYLDGDYEDEREEFLDDVIRAIASGRGSATIEERLSLTLQNVR